MYETYWFIISDKNIIVDTKSIGVISPKNIKPMYSAVTFDFRNIDMLIYTILNIRHHLPNEWPIQIFHGKENYQFLLNSTLSTYIKLQQIILHELTPFTGHQGWGWYTNHMLTNLSFWEKILGEKVLFFQMDTLFCANTPHRITDYLVYDFIGAPWHSKFHLPPGIIVGNGGFSLRNKNKTIKLLKMKPYDGAVPEDVWYSMYFHLVNATIAPLEVAKTFSVESIFYERPVAMHKPVLDDHEIKRLCVTCPESGLIFPFCGRKYR
ncbi:unnamed protein product [Didymodactylos carnosus]|uniref:DUF5672 domain-containing protein n=1 Tax=Didymodactylos carnosus TaxID=1234261 RepID=A0A813YI50_9BILA|nr:unnamed protein product [Didymodactylos carnosus]CAF1483311.1 unnamed protein product [Didymodactylos carnosus]CAF3670087.1 unnamed protein product [Didymodactylos carnosus]CAF4273372.1 unnamed protein product [Didymodactylos carnosus]